MADGGFFRGQANVPTAAEQASTDSVIRRYPAMVWGYICKGPRVTADDRSVKVAFTIKYGSSYQLSPENIEGSGYRQCEAWGQTDVATVMAACDTKETVVCFGEWRVVKYRAGAKSKRGKEKRDYHIFTCHAVIPMGLMAFLAQLYKSPAIRKMIQDEDDETPDPLEAFDDIDIGF